MQKNNKKYMSKKKTAKYLQEEFNDVSQNQNSFLPKKIHIEYKNEKQKLFADTIDKNEITLCIGSAGTGKSLISIYKALELVLDKNNKYEKLFIVTPLVEAEESIGYLKGFLQEKMQPYLYSIYYLIDKLIGKSARLKMVELGIIEPLALTFCRGVNLSDCVMLSDESQNFSLKAIVLLLSRISYNAKFIISGDISQVDNFKNPEECGLNIAIEKLKDVENIGIVKFERSDIVRNPIVGKILDKLN